ncbi:dTDP-3-amino-3,6-dideoxy-alpha-D-glucopyranose N,N-dimethyltransferase [Anaerolineae bacterium]|nr:dTDP-3-amino-3,6-dideoxy-alpha-D-glucopyranose N,N-dimethyltransferase [Anaerolineae bacterium]
MSEAHYARIAGLYDAFVKTDYDVPFFIQEAQAAHDEVLELMAGTGRLTIPLIEAGVSVTCLDFSAEMLAVLGRKLAERGLHAEIHQRNVCDFDLGRQFKLIILPFQAFPELTDGEDQQRALQRIRQHLLPNGQFICTLHNPPVRLKYVDHQLRLAVREKRAEGGHLLVWLLQQHHPATQVVEVLEFFEEYDVEGLLISKRYSALQFHLLEKARFEELITEAGLEVVALYGDYQKNPFNQDTSPFMIWVLRPRVG